MTSMSDVDLYDTDVRRLTNTLICVTGGPALRGPPFYQAPMCDVEGQSLIDDRGLVGTISI